MPTGFELQILSAFTTEKHMVTFPQIGRFTLHTPLKIHSKRLTKTRLQSAIYNLITQLDLGLQKVAADLFFAVATSAEKFCYKQGLQVPKLSPYISPYLEPIYILIESSRPPPGS